MGKASLQGFENHRIPYAVAPGNKIMFPEEALYGSGLMKCPACMARVALTSVGGVLAMTHIMPSPACPFLRRGTGWVRPSAVYSIYGRIKSVVDGGSRTVDVLRRCYTCLSVRTCRLPESMGAVILEYDAGRETADGSHPDIVVSDLQRAPVLLIFVATEERVEIPSYLRKIPSFIVHAPAAFEEPRAIRVSRAYAMPSPECPCQSAERIRAEGEEGKETLECPLEISRGQRGTILLEKCVRCVYYLSLFHGTVTCGFTMGIKRPAKPFAQDRGGKKAGKRGRRR